MEIELKRWVTDEVLDEFWNHEISLEQLLSYSRTDSMISYQAITISIPASVDNMKKYEGGNQ